MSTASISESRQFTPSAAGRAQAREASFATLGRTPQSFIDLGHSKLAYWCFGTGPDLVFVHGWPVHSATFRHVLPRLTADFRCHLIDLPGAGLSTTDSTDRIELAAHARTLREAISKLGLERYALLAHDSGAVAARYMAADDPRVSALVFGNSEIPAYKPPMLLLYTNLVRMPGAHLVMRAVARVPALRHSSLGLRGCFTDPRYADGEFYDLFLRGLGSSSTWAQTAALIRNLDWKELEGLAEVHARIQVPVRLIWGVRDPFFPITRARHTLGQYGGPVDLVEIPDGRLFAHEDHADEFARLAHEFLSANGTSRATA